LGVGIKLNGFARSVSRLGSKAFLYARTRRAVKSTKKSAALELKNDLSNRLR